MKKKKLKALVSAKVNLSLNIKGVRGNFHSLDSVMASVDLTDAITVCERFDGVVNVEFDAPFSIGKVNTVTKAIELIRREIGELGVDVFVTKRLPLSGGLGGSSADAAGVLVLLDKMFDLTGRGLKMPAVGLQVGSDVPYMLEGGFARVSGVGDSVLRLENKCAFFLVLASLNFGVDTTLCYRRFDELFPCKICEPSNNDELCAALKKGDNSLASLQFKNALYESACTIVPSVKVTAEALKNAGAGAVFMSGSGSCVAGVFEGAEAAERAAAGLCGKGFWAKSVTTINSGIKIL